MHWLSRATTAVLAATGLSCCTSSGAPQAPVFEPTQSIDPTLAAAIGPGRWEVVDARTLSFNGIVGEYAPAQFVSVVTTSVEQVVVNSAGGEVNAALILAYELRRRGLHLHIKGYCLSSCANYWAVAAKSVSVDGGVIGLHGNISSCVRLYGGLDAYLAKDFPRGAPEQVRWQVQAALIAEEGFYSTLGLDRFALVEYCRPDKGLGGKVIAFVVPNRTALERLGVHVVSAEPSARLIAAFNRWSGEPMVVERP